MTAVSEWPKGIKLALAGLFVLYAALGTSGLGNDNDTYGMIDAGLRLWLTGVYEYSRPPGYFVPEVLLGLWYLIGGHVLSNAVSALLGVVTLAVFYDFARARFDETRSLLLMALIGFNPYFVIAASSSMDFVYTLCFGAVGVWLIKENRYFVAPIFFGLAGSARLSTILLVIILYAYLMFTQWRAGDKAGMRKVFGSGCLSAALCALAYVPSFMVAGNSFGFLTYYMPEWTPFEIFARFTYKNVALVGVLGSVFVVFLAVRALVRKQLDLTYAKEAGFLLVGILLIEVLFLKVPLEISYLLALLVLATTLFMLTVRPSARALACLVGLVAMEAFVANFDVLDPIYNETQEIAYGANPGLFVRPGVVVRDIDRRRNFPLYSVNDPRVSQADAEDSSP